MTKAELISVIAEEAGITKASASKALESYVDTVAKELKKTGKLGLSASELFPLSRGKPARVEILKRAIHQNPGQESRQIQTGKGIVG
jgi:nucleoid DNA-binding protein